MNERSLALFLQNKTQALEDFQSVRTGFMRVPDQIGLHLWITGIGSVVIGEAL